MIKITTVPRFLVLATIVALIGCSSEFSDRPASRRLVNNTVSYPATHELGAFPSTLNPWEKFRVGRDLSGAPITDPLVLKGDEYFARGDRSNALEFYGRAWAQTQPFAVKESLALRVSGAQLGLDNAKDSLVTLSQFFRENNINTEGVRPEFATVFAYAYGRTGDIDQSLAWFSRLEALSDVTPNSRIEAQIGAAMLLRSRGDADLRSLVKPWSTDTFISRMISDEESRRSRSGGVVASAPSDKPFWSSSVNSSSSSLATASQIDPVVTPPSSLVGPEVVVGTLVPKSGRFSNLGESLSRGIELAFTDTPFPVKLVAEDTLEDPMAAVSAADRLIGVKPAVVLGPLLSEPAAAVAPLMKERGVPQISFSRRQNPGSSPTSFLFGATSESQVYSLFKVAHSALMIDRIAVIYSQDSNGFEYLREARRIAAELGMQIVYETPYGAEYGESFVSIAKEIESANPSAVFFPDDISKATVLVGNFSPLFRKKVKILGSAAWDNIAKLNSARTLLEGCVFVSPYFVRSQREMIKRFNSLFKNSYGVDPDFLAAQGFDAATMALAAIARNQSEGISFEDAFRAIDNYDGLTGKMKVRPDGVVERLYSVVQLNESGLKELTDFNPSTM